MTQEIGITGIIPFTHFKGVQRQVGSTFLRVHALTGLCKDFKTWQHGGKYDNLIFQKAYWIEMMELFKGPKIMDLCDPDWVNDGTEIVKIAGLVDAITCSSEELTLLVKNMIKDKPVFHVPDRLNFNLFPPPRKTHTGIAKKVIWFGYIHNAHETLPAIVHSLKKYNLELTILSDKPYSLEDEIKPLITNYIKYDQRNAYSYIREADIVLNPRSSKAFFKYKSNNKSIISWKLGVPVAAGNEDLERLMNSEERNREVIEKETLIFKEYNIIQSAQDYRSIISGIKY